MDLSEAEKTILTIVFKIAYNQLDVLGDFGYDVTNWNDSIYNRNTVYELAEKLGIEI